ncbi:GTPase subunit of restriction endonuclease [Rubellimicrobium thermophilum DSM 16684]|uniref:GTPase subunit of restriction endonuclease n=1 Tax=Rubellimicrobium thermophilum DSM 16684 TaxID=1123069 RepID=S9R752_9RHOB|nr:AAA family ATPase [Rubellimicrobium thermophilum]EPX87712.1 GTPase subunit of restriction endonuclease [Rubellimicrobium thermophilum DSM 16684]
MTKEHEFKTWLEQGGAQTEAGRNSRAYAIRTIERNLSALGMPHRDLDEAWEADRFEALRERLRKIREDARTGGQDYRILMPDSDNPHNRLSNWGSWLGQYGRFLAGDPPGAAKDADRIRQYVLEHYIEPAREEGREHVDVLVRDVNEALGLKEAWPNICQALAGRIFQDMAQLPEPERIGADQSSATVFRFKLDETVQSDGSRPFVLFDATGAPFQPVKNYNRSSGVSAFRIKPRGAGNKADEAIETEDIVDVARAMLVDGLASRVKAIAGGPVNYLTYGGDKLVRYELSPEIAQAIGVPPRGGVNGTSSADDGRATDAKIQKGFTPMNLILYGPPGTGKTFTTAAEAVRLCGEPVPADRAELMAVYQRLLADGRIEFVTFHQSMSYEEFVEGLRPDTPGVESQELDADELDAAGFRLKIEDGIFKRICERARLDPGEGSGDRRLDRTRPIFKVALGRRFQEEEQIKRALDANEIRHGWSGKIDWSDERFEDWAEIKTELERRTGKEISGHAGELVCTFSFRSDMQVGDYVVISDGRDRMRAFGTIASDYFFEADAEHHPHRRRVEWLWRDDQGTERARFYPNGFRQHTVYKLNGALVEWDGLEQVVFGVDRSIPAEGARPHVLIIDEINRANISKVFGELITLLEPDKRLRAENEIRLTLAYSKRLFGVPSNLHILGTMNTADRSIALLDTALRRRFTFREMMPDASILKDAGQKCGIDLPRLLATINERIEYLYDREHQIGHAYFTACSSQADVDEVMRHKVIPLLAEYFFEDWAKIAAVLGDLEPGEGSITGGFLKRTVLNPPPGLEDGDAVARFRWQVRSVDEGFDYSKLVGT